MKEGLLKLSGEVGRATLLVLEALFFLIRKPPKIKHFLNQITYVAAETSPVVIITSTFTGGVIALQTYGTFHRFNAEFLI
ncbi:MAG: ABC transporter permease, partial [Aquificota bacterium]|nr:ABC transporter permease [Aquificota bacterium]